MHYRQAWAILAMTTPSETCAGCRWFSADYYLGANDEDKLDFQYIPVIL